MGAGIAWNRIDRLMGIPGVAQGAELRSLGKAGLNE